MSSFHNRVRCLTATTGTGTITLGQASAGYCSFNEGGVANGATVSYCLEDGTSFEIGRGVYNSSNLTLTRAAILLSKVAGQAADTSPLSLSGSAVVFITAAAEDLIHQNAVITNGAVARLGIGGATPDATNVLSANLPAVLFNRAVDDVQAKLNKEAAGDTASILFQTGFSGRAEIGTTGDDDLHFKVSPDGSTFHEGIIIDKDNGAVSAPNSLSTVNLTQTGYTDLTEIAEPASPAANVARVRAIDDGTGVTTVGHKDSAGNVVPWSHFNQSGTGNVTRTQQAKLRDFVNVKDFGALGNGSANDTTAVVNAIASLPATGGVVYFPVGVYMVDPDQLVLGNGTNSAISTINDIALVGDSASPYLPSSGVTIKARSSGTVLLDIRGAIFGLRIDNIVFDCDGQCSRGWQAYSVNNSSFRNVGIINFTEYGIFGHCRTGPMGGVAWAAGNIFQNFHITSEDVVDFGSGIILDGSFADGLDWHRTIFQGGVVQVNKGAVSQTTAIHLLFTDSCTWIEVDCGVTGAGAGGGFGIQFNGTSNSLYPQNHFFYGCSIENGTNVAGTISKNYFVNFCTRDSEIIPSHANLIGFTDQGQFFGSHTFSSTVTPTTNDAAALGTTALQWADLHLALGGTIQWNNGDVAITHSANNLAFSGGTWTFGGATTINGIGTATTAADYFTFAPTNPGSNNPSLIVAKEAASDEWSLTLWDGSDSNGTLTFKIGTLLRALGSLKVHYGTAIPAGGTAGAGLTFSSATNFGVFFGSGAPTLSAAQGSLYLRSDGSGTGNRLYVNTNGTTGWTAVTTAA